MKRVLKSGLSIILVFAILFGAAPLSGFKGVGSSLWNGLCSIAASAIEAVEDIGENIASAAENVKEKAGEIIETLTPSNVSDNKLDATGQCGANVYWSFNESTGALTIYGTGAMYNYSFSSNPIYGPFDNNSSIKSVTIESGVTSIGWYAFYACTSLTSIEIPDSVTSIGHGAFEDCSSLTSIEIPDSVTSIGGGTFYGTGYYNDESNWENDVMYIGNYLIDAKNSISGHYSIKDGTILIADDAFSLCESLTSLTIPDSVTSIGYDAFHNCTGLTSVTIDSGNTVYSSDSNGVLYNKDKTELIQYLVGNTRTSFTIPNSVTSIGGGAFKNCTSLTSVTIPDSVTSIGYYAFHSCRSLTSIEIPDSVTSIGERAFYGCSGLTSVTIGNSVTSIGDYAFEHCSGLTNIEIPDNVTSIGERAFYGCSGLTSVTISDSVTRIGSSAFSRCSSLTSIEIPDSVTSIGNYAFYGCRSLTSVTIPDSVTSIGDYAFYYCNKLKDVYYSGSQEQWERISIGSYNSPLTNATIHYNSTGPDIGYYGQTHTVNNYKSAYAEYKKVYFNSAGTPFDGSDGNPDFCIPGLSSSDNLVPQGLGYDADANVIYITSYKSSGDSNSVLFALDGTTGEMIGEYNLCYQNGSDVKSHVGGVAVHNHTIYIASGDSILTYSTSSLGGNKDISATDEHKISGMLNNANCSYVTINDGILWTGNFYDEDEDYNQPAGTTEKYNNSVVLGFDLTKANILDSYDYKFNIDNKIENIQSAYYADGTLYLVTSYGRENDSVVYYVSAKKASGINVAASVLKYFRGLPMMENGFVKDGCLYSIFESAAWKYHGADSKVSRDPSDVVWKIDLGQMKNNACTLKRDTPSFNHDSSAFTLPDNDTYFIENRLYEILKKDAHLLDYAGLIVAKNSKWGGSCYGIASTVALSKNGMLGFNDMTTEQGIASYYDLPKPCDDNRLLSVINYYHLMQKTKNGGEKAIISKNYEWSNGLISLFKDKKHNKATLKEIVNRANEKDLYVLSFSHYMKGHAYVLVDCVKVDGKYKVKLFDCNMIIDFVYMTIESDFSSFTLDTGDYKYGDALKLVDPKLMFDLDGESFTNGSSTQSFKKSAAADDHKRFSVVPERPFTLTNAEGKTLVFDGEDFSGDMAVYDFNIVFNDTACEYEFEIDDSSKFTLDCDGKIDCSIGNNSSYFYAEGENISSVTFSEDTMKMDGENITFKAFASTDELVGEKEPGLVSVSANSTGSVTLTKSENSVEVSAEGKLSDVEASSYIGTEKETQTIEGDTESLTINSSGEEVIEKKEVHSVAINDITIDYKSSATITPQITADVGASYTVTYTSSNPSVATVDNSGNIFGAGVGSATITVTVTDSYNNVVTDSCTVTVNAPPSVKSVSIGDITVGYKSSAVITPKIEKDEGADYEVTFTSSNPSAISVDNNGRVTSNKTFGFTPASATITCTVTDKNSGNSVSDTCKVTVQFTAIQWIIKIVLFGWLWY